MRQVVSFAWRAIVGGLAFTTAVVAASALLPSLGIMAPAAPAGADPGSLFLLMLLAGIVLAAALAPVAGRLEAGRRERWAVVTFFSWTALALNTQIEARIFTTTGATTGSGPVFMLLNYLAGCAALAGVLVALFRVEAGAGCPIVRLRRLWVQRGASDLVGRVLVAALAFVAAYLLFGQAVAPFVRSFYAKQAMELHLPGWGDILLAQLIRGLLFVAACLPVAVAWRRSGRSLVAALSAALFVAVGAFYMIQASWYPVWFRLVHSAEILADSVVFSWALVTVFRPALGLRTGRMAL